MFKLESISSNNISPYHLLSKSTHHRMISSNKNMRINSKNHKLLALAIKKSKSNVQQQKQSEQLLKALSGTTAIKLLHRSLISLK